jgi:hypothetical protein
MNQYSEKRRVPRLLQSQQSNKASFQMLNGMAEFTIDGERVSMPTAEAFQRLLKKVAVLEQRLAVTDNKAANASRAARAKNDR